MAAGLQDVTEKMAKREELERAVANVWREDGKKC